MRRMALLLLVLLSCPSVQASALETPPRMLGQKMIYDPVGQNVILFGGSYYSDAYTFYGDTWSFNVENATWAKVEATGSPGGRFNAGMAFDSDSRKVVLFGGFSASGRKGDTYIYDIASESWKNAYTSGGPSMRSDASMAYDAGAKKVVLFGGYGRDEVKCDDTWVYDVSSNTWTEMNPSTHPQARYGSVMVYDSYSEKCLLFGGHMVQTTAPYDSLGYENEVWAYDYAADGWEKLATENKPPARYWHDLAYDPVGNRIILFGGSQGRSNDLGDTWVYGCREAKWTQVSSTVSPSARTQPSLCYDSRTKKTLLFGGADFIASGSFTYYNDVWAMGEDNQWVELVLGEPTVPTPKNTSVPGFQPTVVAAAIAVAVAVMLLQKRKSIPINRDAPVFARSC